MNYKLVLDIRKHWRPQTATHHIFETEHKHWNYKLGFQFPWTMWIITIWSWKCYFSWPAYVCLVITANCATQQAGQVGGTGKWCHIYGAMVAKLVASNEGQEVPLATSSSPDLALQEIQCSTEPSFQGCRCFRVKPTVGARTAHFGESDEGRTMWGKKIFCSQLIISRSRNAIFSPIHITRKIAVISTANKAKDASIIEVLRIQRPLPQHFEELPIVIF